MTSKCGGELFKLKTYRCAIRGHLNKGCGGPVRRGCQLDAKIIIIFWQICGVVRCHLLPTYFYPPPVVLFVVTFNFYLFSHLILFELFVVHVIPAQR